MEGFGWLRVTGGISPGQNLDDDLMAYAPDVVVWDLGWSPEAGLVELAEADWAELPLVVLLPEENFAGAAWGAGARGLLPRGVSAKQLEASLAAVLEGLAAVDPGMLLPLLPHEPGAASRLAEPLTAREMDVLRLIAEGLPNKAIAVRLEISEFTVKFHVNAILGKLGAQSRTEAAMTAARLGLIPL